MGRVRRVLSQSGGLDFSMVYEVKVLHELAGGDIIGPLSTPLC